MEQATDYLSRAARATQNDVVIHFDGETYRVFGPCGLGIECADAGAALQVYLRFRDNPKGWAFAGGEAA